MTPGIAKAKTIAQVRYILLFVFSVVMFEPQNLLAKPRQIKQKQSCKKVFHAKKPWAKSHLKLINMMAKDSYLRQIWNLPLDQWEKLFYEAAVRKYKTSDAFQKVVGKTKWAPIAYSLEQIVLGEFHFELRKKIRHFIDSVQVVDDKALKRILEGIWSDPLFPTRIEGINLKDIMELVFHLPDFMRSSVLHRLKEFSLEHHPEWTEFLESIKLKAKEPSNVVSELSVLVTFVQIPALLERHVDWVRSLARFSNGCTKIIAAGLLLLRGEADQQSRERYLQHFQQGFDTLDLPENLEVFAEALEKSSYPALWTEIFDNILTEKNPLHLKAGMLFFVPPTRLESEFGKLMREIAFQNQNRRAQFFLMVRLYRALDDQSSPSLLSLLSRLVPSPPRNPLEWAIHEEIAQRLQNREAQGLVELKNHFLKSTTSSHIRIYAKGILQYFNQFKPNDPDHLVDDLVLEPNALKDLKGLLQNTSQKFESRLASFLLLIFSAAGFSEEFKTPLLQFYQLNKDAIAPELRKIVSESSVFQQLLQDQEQVARTRGSLYPIKENPRTASSVPTQSPKSNLIPPPSGLPNVNVGNPAPPPERQEYRFFAELKNRIDTMEPSKLSAQFSQNQRALEDITPLDIQYLVEVRNHLINIGADEKIDILDEALKSISIESFLLYYQTYKSDKNFLSIVHLLLANHSGEEQANQGKENLSELAIPLFEMLRSAQRASVRKEAIHYLKSILYPYSAFGNVGSYVRQYLEQLDHKEIQWTKSQVILVALVASLDQDVQIKAQAFSLLSKMAVLPSVDQVIKRPSIVRKFLKLHALIYSAEIANAVKQLVAVLLIKVPGFQSNLILDLVHQAAQNLTLPGEAREQATLILDKIQKNQFLRKGTKIVNPRKMEPDLHKFFKQSNNQLAQVSDQLPFENLISLHEDRKAKSDLNGMHSAIAFYGQSSEEGYLRQVLDVSKKKLLGFDLIVLDYRLGRVVFVEVKSTKLAREFVKISKNELESADKIMRAGHADYHLFIARYDIESGANDLLNIENPYGILGLISEIDPESLEDPNRYPIAIKDLLRLGAKQRPNLEVPQSRAQ